MKKLLLSIGLAAVLLALCSGTDCARRKSMPSQAQSQSRGHALRIKELSPEDKGKLKTQLATKIKTLKGHAHQKIETLKNNAQKAADEFKAEAKTQLIGLNLASPEVITAIIESIEQDVINTIQETIIQAIKQATVSAAIGEFVSAPEKTPGTFIMLNAGMRQYPDPSLNEAFVVNVGDNIVIQIPENPTTGFVLNDPDFSDEVFSLEANIYLKPQRAAIGAGGQRLFIFKAIKPSIGAEAISIVYGRPWETSESDITYQVTVGVKQPEFKQPEQEFDPIYQIMGLGPVDISDMSETA